QTTHSQSGLATVEHYSFLTERGEESKALAKANDQTIGAYFKYIFTKFKITAEETIKTIIPGWFTNLMNDITADSVNQPDSGSFLQCSKEALFEEGTNATISCELNENSNVTWYFGTAPHWNRIATSEDGIMSNELYGITKDGSLVIRNISHKQEGFYTVQHYTSDYTNSKATIDVLIKASPLNCPEEVTAKEGSEVKIICDLKVNFEVKWYHGLAIPSNVIARIEKGNKSVVDEDIYALTENSSIIVKHLRSEQEGVYTVVQSSMYGRQQSATIVVKKIALSLHCPEELVVKNGSKLIISCILEKKGNVTWYFANATLSKRIATNEDGTRRVIDDRLYVFNEDDSLTINNVWQEMEGTYTIECFAAHVPKKIKIITVKIKASTLNCPRKFAAEEGRNAVISCALAKMSNVTWYVGTAPHSNLIATVEGGTTQVTDNNDYELTDDGSLIIKHIRHGQEGFYTVEYSYSDGGKEIRTVAVYIKENIFTASNLNCPKTVSAKEGSEAIIRCGLVKMSNVKWYRETAPQDPVATIEGETIQITEENLYALTEYGSLTIKHLRHEQEGSYYVEYVTPDGLKQTRTVYIYIRASFLTCRDTVSYEEGRKAIISCNLVGRNVIWYRGSHSSRIAQIEDGTMSVANCNIYEL
ncbi:putative obscurin-like, partial [Apostichopus japonicus]